MIYQDLNIDHGLVERDLETIRKIFKNYPDVLHVHIFGSRVKGTYKKGSDIDLAIMNKGLKNRTLFSIKNDFEESSLPYIVDLVYFPELTHQEFIDHIRRVGKLIYKRATEPSEA